MILRWGPHRRERDDGTHDDGRGDGVLLLHGIARRASSLRAMERAFLHAGFRTLNLDYPAREAGLADLADGIAPAVTDFAARVPRLHIVTHSMGGLVARALISRHRPANLGRVVMLAPPSEGSEVADRLANRPSYRRFFGPAGAELGTARSEAAARLLGPVDYPLGIIAGDRSLYPVASLLLPRPNDGRVSVARTRLPGMADHITLHAAHPTILWNGQAIRAALRFVRHGRFGPTARPRQGGVSLG